MNLAAKKQPPTVRLRRLAAELRALRQAAGLTREDAAEQTHMNSATLWRIETARARPQRRTLLALLDKYDLTDQQRRTDLVDLAKDAVQLGWLQAYEDLLPDEYTAYISFEAEARSLRNYESQFVPGLLQTEAYARAVITGLLPNVDEEKIKQRVDARMQRQESITKEPPLNLWVIMDEAVLHRNVGGADVMREQYQHLAKLAKLPHITLQVLPYEVGAHPGMHGAFAIMDFPDPADPALIYIENMTGALFLERPADVENYTTMFEHLRAVALGPAESRKMISQLIDPPDERK
jgi:transcriptional regulator with XRE-family HTH domain